MPISEEIFYDKELSDKLRDITMNSACAFDPALRLLKRSNNHDRDVEIIKKLSNCGFSERKIMEFLTALNS